MNYRIHPRLQIGVEYNPGEQEVGPLLTWFILPERHGVPGVFFGTSSDRIGTDEGQQSYYLTAVKGLPWFPASVYATLNYSEADEGFSFPFGATFDLSHGFSVRPMYDGDRSHLMASYGTNWWSVSLLYVWWEEPGISFGFGF
ncbi:MAG: hypothetical protein HKN12_07540 [Gemmatimonadetes bacterium]|nr:hypothetical protein [Gemmatimonadota bacterium]